MDDDELPPFLDELHDDDGTEAFRATLGLSGYFLRRLRRPSQFESVTGRRMYADGLWEVTVYADNTVMFRVVGADEPEQDVTAIVDEYERRAREEEGPR